MVFRVRAGEVDLERREVRRGDQVLVLSSIETELLQWLVERPGQVATRDQLLVEVWGFPKPVATRAVDNTVMRLRRKIELDPSVPEHLQTLRGVGYTFEPLAAEREVESPAPTSVGLPKASVQGRFFGRQRELDALGQTVSRARCVTVLGPGGVGKTRLVHEWARERRDVVICALAAARAESDVCQAVATALGSSSADAERLAQALAARPLVMVLDNVEQVAGPVATLVLGWMSACPELRVVMTSRERLRIGPEHVVEVPPLEAHAAVELFEHHARVVGGLDGEPDERIIRDIVQRLDGLPLAVELAAARTRVLSLSQLLGALHDTSRVLRSQRRDLPDRHRSVSAVVRGSWEALDPSGQTLLASLALLVDGFDMDTVEGVVDLGADGPWPLDVVAELRDRSLLQARAGFEGDARLSMLEVVRQFADAARRELPEADVIEDRVIDWFLARSGRWRAGIHQARPEPSIQALVRERQNLVALARGCAERRPQAAAQLVYNLGWHLLNRTPDPGTLELGVTTADRAGDARLRVANRLLYGRILEWTDRQERALVVHRQALDMARALDPVQVPIACFHVTSHLGRRSEVDEAVTLCRLGMEAADEHGKPIVGAMLQQRLGVVLSGAGRHIEARPALERALEGYTRLGQDTAVPYAMLSLAISDGVLGDLPAGIRRAEEVVRRAEALSVTRLRGAAVLDLSVLLLAAGRPDEAAAALDGIAESLRSLDDANELAAWRVHRAGASLALGEPVDGLGLRRAVEALRATDELAYASLGAVIAAGLGVQGVSVPPSAHPDRPVFEAWRAWMADQSGARPVPLEAPSWADVVLRGIGGSVRP